MLCDKNTVLDLTEKMTMTQTNFFPQRDQSRPSGPEGKGSVPFSV